MPRRTARDLAEYAETWATRGVRGWEDRWWEMPREVGDKVARIIGAPAGSVSMHENVTTAHAVALSCLRPTGTRRRIVCAAMDFPSMLYLFRAQEAAGFASIHVGKSDIEKDKIRMVAFHCGKGLSRTVSHMRFKLLMKSELFRQRKRKVLIIVDNQDIARVAHN